jgi:hypothetical protein
VQRRSSGCSARSRATASSSNASRPILAHFLPEVSDEHLDGDVVRIDLNRPMDEIRAELSRYP